MKNIKYLLSIILSVVLLQTATA
ncbi:MAG: hypothetical protein JWQ85_3961, partial [Mucilaginibacter sp.]|nr:hypothetical protein [Mucilaginibacter sp.]